MIHSSRMSSMIIHHYIAIYSGAQPVLIKKSLKPYTHKNKQSFTHLRKYATVSLTLTRTGITIHKETSIHATQTQSFPRNCPEVKTTALEWTTHKYKYFHHKATARSTKTHIKYKKELRTRCSHNSILTTTTRIENCG